MGFHERSGQSKYKIKSTNSRVPKLITKSSHNLIIFPGKFWDKKKYIRKIAKKINYSKNEFSRILSRYFYAFWEKIISQHNKNFPFGSKLCLLWQYISSKNRKFSHLNLRNFLHPVRMETTFAKSGLNEKKMLICKITWQYNIFLDEIVNTLISIAWLCDRCWIFWIHSKH